MSAKVRRRMSARMRDIGWVYLFAAVGLTLVAISLFGNILGSFSDTRSTMCCVEGRGGGLCLGKGCWFLRS